MAVRDLVSQTDLECLSLNLYFEARNESRLSHVAINQVVFNRVASPRFPDSICGVIKQGVYIGDHPVRNFCQFSWYCDGRHDNPLDKLAFSKVRELSRWMLIARDFTPQLVHGAMWYHADYVRPRWSFVRKKVLQVDSHIFYR